MTSSRIGGVRAGPDCPVRIMGVINASPESHYKGSVCSTARAVRDRARSIEGAGGDYVDIGGMSTAPYLDGTLVSEREESGRVVAAVRAALDACNLPVSVDTCRAAVARAALEEGACIVNDISGLKHDRMMAGTVKRHGASVILGAYGGPGTPPSTSAGGAGHGSGPVWRARDLLAQSVEIASGSGIAASGVAVDPSIGFFRKGGSGRLYTRLAPDEGDWVSRDLAVLAGLDSLRVAGGMPVAVSVSNKSFLGVVTGRDAASARTYGSVAAEAIAVTSGADIIRTHHVEAARDAVALSSRMAGRPRHDGPGEE